MEKFQQINLPKPNEISWFRKKLGLWWIENQRHFYWRMTNDPYITCIAEIFLQQTSANKVSKMIEGFINKYPDWHTLSFASYEDLTDSIFSLGLYRQRAQTLHDLASLMKMHGDMPNTRKKLEQYPGIGQYIASVILVVVFGRREPFLDVNMSRLIERFFGPRNLADIRYDPYLQYLSRRVVNTRNPLQTNWMILDFAALCCKKRNPLCSTCILRKRCKWYFSIN